MMMMIHPRQLLPPPPQLLLLFLPFVFHGSHPSIHPLESAVDETKRNERPTPPSFAEENPRKMNAGKRSETSGPKNYNYYTTYTKHKLDHGWRERNKILSFRPPNEEQRRHMAKMLELRVKSSRSVFADVSVCPRVRGSDGPTNILFQSLCSRGRKLHS